MSSNILFHSEHCDDTKLIHFPSGISLEKLYYENNFKKTHRNKETRSPCFQIKVNPEDKSTYSISSSYFIGLDWLDEDNQAIQINPKLNEDGRQVDFLGMLFGAMKHKEVANEIKELYDIKWDKPQIEIEQKNDLLTPFLAVEYLNVVKQIVKKGLKKSYYRKTQNLKNKVKGKILVGQNIKHNLVKNRIENTYCSYEEFGIDNKENRLIKKTNQFLSRYLSSLQHFSNQSDLQNLFNFINPSFSRVSPNINIYDIKVSKFNSFYPEYQKAIELAKIILRRFGYNISNTEKRLIKTPPFWIDMSYLFELYVLGLLKDRFHKKVSFQVGLSHNILDFLLNSEDYQMVIDAKYKGLYADSKVNTDDIRQVSGYGRLKRVYDKLEKTRGEVIDCLIIHPDMQNGLENLNEVNLKQSEINGYYNIYQIGVVLPMVKN